MKPFISRSIWAKLIKGKGRESVCYRHCPCGSGRRSVERRQKASLWSVSQSHGHEPHQESNQRNARSDLSNAFRALPVRPTVTAAPDQQRPCPCYSREVLEIESSTALREERMRGSGMSAVARQGRASSVAATVVSRKVVARANSDRPTDSNNTLSAFSVSQVLLPTRAEGSETGYLLFACMYYV